MRVAHFFALFYNQNAEMRKKMCKFAEIINYSIFVFIIK